MGKPVASVIEQQPTGGEVVAQGPGCAVVGKERRCPRRQLRHPRRPGLVEQVSQGGSLVKPSLAQACTSRWSGRIVVLIRYSARLPARMLTKTASRLACGPVGRKLWLDHSPGAQRGARKWVCCNQWPITAKGA